MMVRGARSTTGSRGSEEVSMPDRQGWEATKRAIYLGAIALSVPTVPLVLWLRWDEEPLLRLTYPLLLAVLCVLFLGLLTDRIAPTIAERVILVALPVLWLVRLSAVLYLQPDLSLAAQVVNQSIGPGVVILGIIAYLALPARQGLLVAGGFVLACMAVVLPRVVTEMIRVGVTSDVIGLLRVGVTTGVSVALLYALATLKEQVALERARAEGNATLARTDQLTGLPNRRAIHERLQELLALADRHGRPLTLAVVDVDHFKRINDTAGHLAGDEVLRAVAAAMSELLRDSDVIGRWGGDELLIVLPETTADAAMASLQRVLDQVRTEVRPPLLGPGGMAPPAAHPVTLSAGVAQRRIGDDQDRLLRRADRALYRAKEGGRDRVIVDGVELAEV
jgi:diguanylate cyclase (GGDEF)-like protein